MKTLLSSSLSIDPVGPEYAESLSELARRAYYDHFSYLWNDGGTGYVEATFPVDVLRRELMHPDVRYFLARRDQQPVGYTKIVLNAPLERQTSALELQRIYVRKEAVGRGVGQQLMHKSIEIARFLAKEIIWLKVMGSSRDSIAFYQQQGFVNHAGTTFRYPGLKSEYQAMYVMKKILAHDD